MARRLAALASALQSPADQAAGLQGRLVFIDALRGLSAVMIALHHIDRYEPLTAASAILPDSIQFMLKEGRLAVQVFFIISGFMIARSLRRTVLTPAVMGRFSLRRLIRLGLPYWTILAAVLAMDVLLPWGGLPPLNAEFTAGQVASEVFFVQYILGYSSTSTGLWFICIEVQFFLLFLAMLFVVQRLRRRGPVDAAQVGWPSRLVVFVPMALLSLFLFNLSDQYHAWVVYFFGVLFLGTILCWTLDGSVPRAAFWLYILAIVVRLAVRPTMQLEVALSAAVLIYGVGRLGRLNRWLSFRWLQYLGTISYSLFLVHYPVSHVVKCIAHRLTGDTPGIALAWLGLAFALSVVAAHFFYHWVERPASQLAERLKAPRVTG